MVFREMFHIHIKRIAYKQLIEIKLRFKSYTIVNIVSIVNELITEIGLYYER